MISVEHLTKNFGAFTAVNDISFQVKAGEVLGFLGPNGAGKSTTMKMLSGFLAPSSGSVSLFGYNIERQPLQAKEILGYLPEGAPVYAEMTVHGFLQFIADIRGLKGSQKNQALEQVIERVELGSVLKNKIATLSKGFTRRVGLAQAIIHDPQVLILDEPTDGLDPNQKHQVRNLIRNLATDKIVIISTHILEEVSAVCSRALIIAQGTLVEDATPKQLEAQSKYHHAVSIRFNQTYGLEPLRQLADVAELEVQAEGLDVTVFPKSGQVLLNQINRLISEQNWDVDTLHVERGRLDDVFRSITEARA